jgi:hypothetical protein
MAPPPTSATLRELPSWAALLAGLALLALAWAMATFFTNVHRPESWVNQQQVVEAGIDPAAVALALDPARVQARQDEILALGSRFLGQPGSRRAGEFMRAAFERAGLEILEHTVTTPSPVTEYREILDASGRPLPGVEVAPFFPNHFQPVTTGSQGLAGRLELLTPEFIRSGRSFRGIIGVIDARDGAYDPSFAFNWVRYAQLGLEGLIVTDSRGLASAPWHLIAAESNGMVASTPVNFVRLAAPPAILDHLGRDVRLRVKSAIIPVENTTYYGVLRAPHPADEALVILVPYDALSVLPDMAPGAIQAVNPAFCLQLLEVLAAHRAQLRRDVVFVAYGSAVMGDDAVNHLARILQKNTKRATENNLLRALGLPTPERENQRLAHLRQRALQNSTQQAHVHAVRAALESPGFLQDADATSQAMAQLSPEASTFFQEQFTFVLNSVVLELTEPMLQKRIAFLRRGDGNVQSREFQAYLRAKKVLDEFSLYAGYKPVNLLRQQPALISTHRIAARLAERIHQLEVHHAATARRLQQEIAIAQLFNQYQNINCFIPRFAPGAGAEVLHLDNQAEAESPSDITLANVFESSALRMADGRTPLQIFRKTSATGRMVSQIHPAPNGVCVILDNWGYKTFLLINLNRQPSYVHYASPVVLPFMRDLSTLRQTLLTSGSALADMACGRGVLTASMVREWIYLSFGGQVLVSNVGRSIVPNHPLPGALLTSRGREGAESFSKMGYYHSPLALADPYGKYLLEFNSNDFAVMHRVYDYQEFSPLAAGFDDEGFIRFIKDEGEEGQRLFKSTGISLNNRHLMKNVTLVTFRASPMALLDLNNPQTMKDYTGLRLLNAAGMTAPRKSIQFQGLGLNLAFVDPDLQAYLLLQSGAPGNDLAQVTRAFMLGIRDPSTLSPNKDIDGPGYLALDHPILQDPPLEAARSMAAINGRRLKVQQNYHMADAQTLAYQERTLKYLAAAEAPDNTHRTMIALARKAVTYATLNHPVIRASVLEAVVSILWYLGLLVPFVFFFEKLVFCHSDVRYQIAAQVVIFLVVFGLLRLLHPAFEMVRSSLMILLGFIIMLISCGMTLLFSGKFQQNLEDLRKKRGKVSGADVNTLGVIGSAFMLGLNNMHRRKVRTGLTCATLTLLTFVMISFTSTRSDIAREDTPIGKAPYQGMLVKKERFEPLSPAEIFALRSKFGENYQVAPRQFYIGSRDSLESRSYNPEFQIVFEEPGASARSIRFLSMLQFSPNEPLRDQIEFLTPPVWFTPEDLEAVDRPAPVLLPDGMAAALGITPEMVRRAPVPVRINGVVFHVTGIFRASSLETVKDLDGLDLRPFDIEQLTDITVTGGRSPAILVADNSPRISANSIVIAPIRSYFGAVHRGSLVFSSVAIHMPETPYKEAFAEIEAFMEQTGQPLYYGLDGVATKGKRARETSLEGLVDLIIPLIIAGLTVLNTMKGSVYERRDEIYVYNAVGIAPRYVFFMFMAEAMVYAVVGSVLGYLLSQGTGRILTELGWTGGMNMTYASLSTIYASLTIMAAVFVSTWFPARSAMEIAKPADDAGWKLPEPQGDELVFDLPFNFRARGRMAVLSFFDRYLLDHAEGSAGRFYASTPRMLLLQEDAGPVPALTATIWLKPFDLAVSQKLVISLPVDPETGQFKARIRLTRLSGTREAWIRLNRSFVTLVRRHFLHWRAVTPAERAEMFEEAREKFERELLPA